MPTKYPQIGSANWIHEIIPRKNFGSTNYPREKILNPQNIYEKKFQTHEGSMTLELRDSRFNTFKTALDSLHF